MFIVLVYILQIYDIIEMVAAVKGIIYVAKIELKLLKMAWVGVNNIFELDLIPARLATLTNNVVKSHPH